AGIEVEVGLLAEQAQALNKGFLHRMRTGRPYVQLKLAASLDGRTALANGESKGLTGVVARQDVQQFSSKSSAILSTAATLITDNPALTVRHTDLPEKVLQYYAAKTVRQPLRVIIDSQARLDKRYQIMHDGQATLLVSGQAYQQTFTPSVST